LTGTPCDRRRIVSGRFLDHRPHLETEKPAGAPTVSFADRGRKRRSGPSAELAEAQGEMRLGIRDDHQVVGKRIRQRRFARTDEHLVKRAPEIGAPAGPHTRDHQWNLIAGSGRACAEDDLVAEHPTYRLNALHHLL